MTRAAMDDLRAVADIARPAAASWLLQTVAFATAAMLVGFTLLRGSTSLPPSSAVVWVTAIPTLLGPLFWPDMHGPGPRLASVLLSWTCVVLLLAGIGWAAFGMHFALVPAVFTSAVALGIIVVACLAVSVIEATLDRLGIRSTTVQEIGVWMVTSVLWLAASTPLWLGPVADLSARQSPQIPSLILACSPLAQLASASGHDVLRGQWFYGHSSLGSLQVDYPQVGTVLVAYLLLAVTFASLLAGLRRASRHTP